MCMVLRCRVKNNSLLLAKPGRFLAVQVRIKGLVVGKSITSCQPHHTHKKIYPPFDHDRFRSTLLYVIDEFFSTSRQLLYMYV